MVLRQIACLDFSEAFDFLSVEFLDKSSDDHADIMQQLSGFRVCLKSLENPKRMNTG